MCALGSVKVRLTKGWQQIHEVMTPGTGGNHHSPYGVNIHKYISSPTPGQLPQEDALRIGLQACMAPVELQHFKPLESSLAASLFNLDYLCIVKTREWP